MYDKGTAARAILVTESGKVLLPGIKPYNCPVMTKKNSMTPTHFPSVIVFTDSVRFPPSLHPLPRPPVPAPTAVREKSLTLEDLRTKEPLHKQLQVNTSEPTAPVSQP